MGKIFETTAQNNSAWRANLNHVEKHGADFFITGGTCAAVGLDLNYFPHAKGRGVNLAYANQTLQQACSVAQHVFEHAAIKFVLIDLSPCIFRNEATIATGDAMTNADLNLDRIKNFFEQRFSTGATTSAGVKLLTVAERKENLQTLEAYVKLCNDNKAIPVGVLFPVDAEVMTFNEKKTSRLNQTLAQLEKKYKFNCIDLRDSNLASQYFYDGVHLNSAGAAAVSALLGLELYQKKIISAEKICGMSPEFFDAAAKPFPKEYRLFKARLFCETSLAYVKQLSNVLPAKEQEKLLARIFDETSYEHLSLLSKLLPKDKYNSLAERIFESSLQKIRLKKKIRVRFFLAYSSMWCGDELYNLFAHDERFDTKILLRDAVQSVVSKENLKDLERFRSRGLNVSLLGERIAKPDILICLMPYANLFPPPLQFYKLKVSTLIVYIPYSLSITNRTNLIQSSTFFRVVWRAFFPSTIQLELYEKNCKVGMPRGIYSGYPKMDVFFQKNANFRFEWKTVRPNAKKIIWAPHHSITNKGVLYATFHWNYRFMYDFAKAHPDISWVVKPHPRLSIIAVKEKIFASVDDYNAYLQAWNELPNAQVYTGAYYQAVFATSDGMIQDCGSFIAEYQYVDKPMIFLTRDTDEFSELGKKILETAYLVDGQNFAAIAATIQRVFIDGDDFKAAARRKVFDECLNYPKRNGMTASEFIFKNISDALAAQ